MPFYRIFKKNKENKENNILNFKKNEEIQNAQNILEFKIIKDFTQEDIQKITNRLNSKNLKIDFTDFMINRISNKMLLSKENVNLIQFIIETNNIIDLNKKYNDEWYKLTKITLFIKIMMSISYESLTHLNICKKNTSLNLNENLGYGVTFIVYMIAFNKFKQTKYLIQEGAKNFQIKLDLKINIFFDDSLHMYYSEFHLYKNDTIIEVLKRSKFTIDQKLELSDLLREKKLV